MANCYSSCDRELEQTAAMFFPRVTVYWSSLRDSVTADFIGRVGVQRRMFTQTIVVIFETIQLSLQVNRIPE